MSNAQFSAAAKQLAAEREVAYRRRVYPRLIIDGKITDGFAAVQIAIMEEIAHDYAEQAAKERLL
jgi:hypothetical protein